VLGLFSGLTGPLTEGGKKKRSCSGGAPIPRTCVGQVRCCEHREGICQGPASRVTHCYPRGERKGKVFRDSDPSSPPRQGEKKKGGGGHHEQLVFSSFLHYS